MLFHRFLAPSIGPIYNVGRDSNVGRGCNIGVGCSIGIGVCGGCGIGWGCGVGWGCGFCWCSICPHRAPSTGCGVCNLNVSYSAISSCSNSPQTFATPSLSSGKHFCSLGSSTFASPWAGWFLESNCIGYHDDVNFMTFKTACGNLHR